MPSWLGGPEIIIIILVVVLLFGFKKLPDAARSLGRSMRIFKAEVDEMKRDDKPSAASQETVEGSVQDAPTKNDHVSGQATPATGGTAATMPRVDAQDRGDTTEPRA